jgi:diaminohydroxyphosphoribosylaminopyrimidine deaminase/5-amino-6-(5-phosphoribosylamino)uracil reductase
MSMALALARRGLGATSPNPAVGAVVVRGGEVVGRGWHARAGEPHAEVVALRAAGARARGAELFVTLEPCCHHGRTPPCTHAILAFGVRRVVAAMKDPFDVVAGKGIALLKRRGVHVDVGCLGAESAALNAAYLKRVTTAYPFVTLKAALSLDGRIAAPSGESQWITGAAARAQVQALRAKVDAIAVGVGTVLADDPRLTVRVARRRRPIRVVFDATLRTPPGARLFRDGGGPVIVVARGDAPVARSARLRAAGAGILRVPGARAGEGVALAPALRALAHEGINHLLVEGGGRLATSLLASRLVDRLVLFYAPILLGGERLLVGNLGIPRLEQAPRLEGPAWRRVGRDICFTGLLKSRSK